MDFQLSDCGLLGSQVKYCLGNMHEFGNYVVVIDDADKLISRIHNVVRKKEYKYICGPIQYKKMKRNGSEVFQGNSIVLKEDINLLSEICISLKE